MTVPRSLWAEGFVPDAEAFAVDSEALSATFTSTRSTDMNGPVGLLRMSFSPTPQTPGVPSGTPNAARSGPVPSEWNFSILTVPPPKKTTRRRSSSGDVASGTVYFSWRCPFESPGTRLGRSTG